MCHSRSIQPLPPVVEYVKMTGTSDAYNIPVIAQAYRPGEGWKNYPFRKRISRSWAVKMAREGYTAVGLALDGYRIADFQLKELLSVPAQSMKAPARAGTR